MEIKNVYMAETINTPLIVLDKDKGIIRIKGKSIPENTGRYYKPIIDWVDEYSTNPQKKTNVSFEIEYMNSTTLKFYYLIMKRMEEIFKRGLEVDMVWCYEDDDEDVQETGEYLQSVVEVPVKLIPMKPEE